MNDAVAREIDLGLVYAGRRRSEWLYAWWSVLGTSIGSFFAVIIAVAQGGMSLFYIALSVVMLLLTGFGVSAGLHRYFAAACYVQSSP